MLQNLETEQTLIGLAMQDAECAENLARLPSDTFAYNETRVLHKTIREMLKNHETPNIVSLGTKVSEYRVSVMDCARVAQQIAISPALYKQLEREALDLRKRRILQKACTEVANKAADPMMDIDSLASVLTTAVNDNGNQDELAGMQSAVMEFINDLGKENTMIGTGIAGLDRLVGGLQNGMLAILGARPKVGKTALALSMAVDVARKKGPVLIVSLEMTSKEIMARIMAAESGVDMHRIVTHKTSEDDAVKLAAHYGEVSELPIWFTRANTPLTIRREAGRIKRKKGLALIMVDYIQLMRSDEAKKSRYEEVSAISRELKLMAMELDVPILALTQFNRESESGGVRRKPSMSEARDSGSIEQDANLFLIQYPPGEPNPGSDFYEYWAACKTEGTEFQVLEVAANRQGPTGNIMLRFDKQHMQFTTMMRRAEG